MVRSQPQADDAPRHNRAPWVFVLPVSAADAERCHRLGLAIAAAASPGQWAVRRTPEQMLELRAPDAEGPLTLSLDLRRGPLARRLATARRDQPLPRALGLHRRDPPPTIVDATAGLGRDALLLAHLGCRVEACERVPVLAVLVDDAAERANCRDRLTVHCVDAAAFLTDHGDRSFDAVYLDPMYPTHGRAQVKKEMQVCRLLAGPPESTANLLHCAFAAARERVVVKRHPHELPLAGPPSFTVDGERVRFDVYLKNPASQPSAR